MTGGRVLPAAIHPAAVARDRPQLGDDPLDRRKPTALANSQAYFPTFCAIFTRLRSPCSQPLTRTTQC
jgi:hypothetical protein